MKPYIQAKLEHNVHVIIGKPKNDGTIAVREDRRFKNTATRLMTESICEYLAGDENSYNRGHGRPNFMGFGTMGIRKQGNLGNPTLESQFEDPNPPAQDRTRPWFESTSLALTDTCGEAITIDGVNPHFWNPKYGWGTADKPDEPVFEGELCTAMKPSDAQTWKDNGWEIIQRIPILRADVLSDCPQDLDYGVDGYSSSVIFYGYASVLWVNNMLNPKQKKQDAIESESQTEPVGPQLNRMAISEFGLYEKNNTDPHGLHTLLAGFRVPSADDIVYVSKNEVILVEWRITVRALMPYEGVRVVTEPAPTGIAVLATYLGETATRAKEVQVTGVVKGDPGVRQDIIWTLDNADEAAAGTYLSSSGLLTVDKDEKIDVLYVSGASIVDPSITSRTAILTGLLKNFVTGITLTTESITSFDIQFRATVLGRGTFSQNVTWKFGDQKPDKSTTTISDTGLLHMDFEETADKFQIVATSMEDADVFSVAAVVRYVDVSDGSKGDGALIDGAIFFTNYDYPAYIINGKRVTDFSKFPCSYLFSSGDSKGSYTKLIIFRNESGYINCCTLSKSGYSGCDFNYYTSYNSYHYFYFSDYQTITKGNLTYYYSTGGLNSYDEKMFEFTFGFNPGKLKRHSITEILNISVDDQKKDKTAGTYVISDVTILTEGGE